MGQFLKDNWFKLGILVVLIIIALSTAYYFVIFIPNNENAKIEQKNREAEQKILLEEKQQADIKNSLAECLDSAETNYVNDWNNACETVGKEKDCTLIHITSERLDDARKTAIDNCYKRYPQN